MPAEANLLREQLTEAEIGELVEIYANDFNALCEDQLRINSKGGGDTISFEWNKAQRYLHSTACAQIEKYGWVRILDLKGRQMGSSTYITARGYWLTTFNTGRRSFILTHLQDATDTLFDMVKTYHEGMNPDLRPPVASDSYGKVLKFGGIQSGYGVGTAGSKAIGRSRNTQFFHGSEVAFWQFADTHKAGAIQTVPRMPGTEIWLESTANGVGNMFHTMWEDAKGGHSEYWPVFLPWYWMEDYRAEPMKGMKLTRLEHELMRTYGLDKFQLQWRRHKIIELKPSEGGNPEDLFKQEYPCNPEEAFLFSGRPVFSQSDILMAMQECFKYRFEGEISLSTGKFQRAEEGRLKVWEMPIEGRRYVVGADVAEGLEHGDYSVAYVLDQQTGYIVACWYGKMAPDLFGVLLYRLGKRYNNALLGVEANNHGLTTLVKIRDLGYKRYYVREEIDRRAEGHQTKKMGWLTTQKSKWKIIDMVAINLRLASGMWDRKLLEECQTFVMDDSGRPGAADGYNDDRVMAYAIALEMLRAAPAGRVIKAAKQRETPQAAFQKQRSVAN